MTETPISTSFSRAARAVLAVAALLIASAPAAASVLEFSFAPSSTNTAGVSGSFQVDESFFLGAAGPTLTLDNSVISAFDFSSSSASWGLTELLTSSHLLYDVTGALPVVLGSPSGVAEPVAQPGTLVFLPPGFAPMASVFSFDSFADGTGTWTTERLGGGTNTAPAPGTLLLLGAALAGLGVRGRRRHR